LLTGFLRFRKIFHPPDTRTGLSPDRQLVVTRARRIPGRRSAFVHVRKMKPEKQAMTDSRWEFPIVLMTSAVAFLSVWHFVSPLFN
jgi:hypothetical protein